MTVSADVLRAAITMAAFGLGAVAVTFLVALCTKLAGRFLRDGQALDVTMPATVAGKRSRMDQEDGGSLHYYAAFEPDGKRILEVEVTAGWYEKLREGSHGYLTVKDRAFVSFTPDEEVAKA